MRRQPIISAPALREILDHPRLRLFDCRFSLMAPGLGRSQYLEAHVPGARYVHLDEDLSGEKTPSTGRHPLPAMEVFRRRVESWGVGGDSIVVVYDAANCAIAGRMWWMARWLGLDDVRVLDGGFPAWREAGFESSRAVPGFPAGRVDARDAPAMPVAELVEIEAIAARDSGLSLLDARDAARYAGEQEPIDPVAGHVPNARNVPLGGNLDGDGLYLSRERLVERFRPLVDAAGGASNLVHMCGSGVSACHNVIAMELAGFPGSVLYPGSFSEWIADPARPVETSS